MGFFKDNTIEVTYKGEKHRIAKSDKSQWDKLSKKKPKKEVKK